MSYKEHILITFFGILSVTGKIFKDFSVNSVLIFHGKIICIWQSDINLDIYAHKIRNIFNKIVNLAKIVFKSNLYNSILQVGIIWWWNSVQVTTCTANLVRVATCTKSQLVHNIYIY